ARRRSMRARIQDERPLSSGWRSPRAFTPSLRRIPDRCAGTHIDTLKVKGRNSIRQLGAEGTLAGLGALPEWGRKKIVRYRIHVIESGI
ncbi:hypothetical protein, partial [Rhizobium sp. MHM7A]|uniref:hypothetical protein n=1 Tax=Rhizobium sp. MHM7A TaxID=2583233 RepID=UPI0019800430